MEIKSLTFGYRPDTAILDDISVQLPKGKITTIIGANGCGKSTLLRLMTKNLTPTGGEIVLDGKNLKNYPLRAFAQKVAIVHQKNSAPEDLTVERLVAYGRIPHTHMLRSGTVDDQEKIAWALRATGIDDLADRTLGTLSGGQRQRAYIAMALAQGTDYLFLDEPTTFLDVRYQVEILRLVRHLNENYGITIAMVLHDINQALAYSHEIIGLKSGRICAQGAPKAVINRAVIKHLYDIELDVFERDGTLCVMTI